MKWIIKSIASFALSILVYQAGFAQDTSPNANQNQENAQNRDNTQQSVEIPQQTQQDLMNRYPDLDEQTIIWDNNDEIYSATYNRNDKEYMSRYDTEGNWLETMERREWDDNVPEHIKMGLNDNRYENYEVDSYWEITESDAARGQGYYFNLRDKDGNAENIRMDSEGKIINESDYDDPR